MGKPRKPKTTPEGDPIKSPAAKAQDDQVMGTNNSSIVSKRSVEKLYFPSEEPEFFRYFVKKFQRRAPLINRGYWLRLRVIDVLVRNFLLREDLRKGKDGKEEKKKVVVNLGCGSDVLPWQCLTRYLSSGEGEKKERRSKKGVKFVDVDFPDLILKKKQTVLSTPELVGMLNGVNEKGDGKKVVLESEEYAQVGCDLRDLKGLQEGLQSAVGGSLESCEFIFVAEVSITYMETEGADGVVKWASTVGDAEFVLLEQILPDGPGHPFAATMLSHFDKLNTQLKSVAEYPTVADQHERFTERGWKDVTVKTLWETWADEGFVSQKERRHLDELEEFDEWEEFALFASHYCVVRARTVVEAGTESKELQVPSTAALPIELIESQFDEGPRGGQKGQRRFAAAMEVSGEVVINTFGLGTSQRLQSCDVFTQDGKASGLAFGLGGPTARMCHSLTELGNGKVLLAGGRGRPSDPLKDCWLFDKKTKGWSKTHDLPVAVYRHSVVAVGETGMALLLGGRGKTETDLCLLYSPEKGWMELAREGAEFTPSYGGALCCGNSHVEGSFNGVYVGGLADGLFTDKVFSWELNTSNLEKPVIKFTQLRPAGDLASQDSNWLVARFGASCIQHGDEYVLLGGVTRDHLLNWLDEVVVFSVDDGEFTVTRQLGDIYDDDPDVTPPPRPLYTGHSVVKTPDGSVVIVGGGATCFSMGTFWNKGVYTLPLASLGLGEEEEEEDEVEHEAPELPHWIHEKTIDINPVERSLLVQTKPRKEGESISIKPIDRVQVKTSEDFIKIVRNGKPVVVEGLDLGKCVKTWNLQYLAEKVGTDRKVVVHEATSQVMDFNAKNFKYVTTEFGDLAKRVEKGDKLYLRALSHEKPTEKASVLEEDFPALSPDFVLPEQLSLVKDNLFSSVLRLSGPVNMWLHYDVMANVYCQISGSKRLILFPPGDVEHLSFAPGASSSSIDVFSSLGSPELAHTHPCEAILGPGEVLFLPPLWLHTATPTSDKSIAVNVFFRDLGNSSYAAGKDVYGNRDLAAYEKGRQDVNRIANSFQKLPAEAREFYLLRLADELRRKARG
ncbi:putative leucine carboxyl methyltransferase 2 [Podospora australis]|uniref:tRNA wybutosine-synthesizing protein 4 n=1 Tax=Podospora australis TaxID=1536484 RepID=A0AAN6X2J8_9PEZI|nr:putative leucine carboxyl methyltransferase 2 [Podospora australis]